MADAQVAGGLQETWESRKVQASILHPSPSSLVRQHVLDNQGALTGTMHTLTSKRVSFIGNIPPGSTQGGGCSLNPGIPWVKEEPACPMAEHAYPLPALSSSLAK